MRASRLLNILLLLQTRGRMTAQALAEEFEVSVRTIYRDVDQLSAAGVPVYGDRGPAGGFQLLDGYRTRLTGMTDAEVESLFFAGLPGPAGELGLAELLATAQLKLVAALPPDRQNQAGRMAERFHLDPTGWFRSPDAAERLPELAAAVWEGRRIAVTYERWSGVVERRLGPLGLVLKAGIWYLVAEADGQPRTYRVSGIRRLEILEDGVRRPDGFVLAGYWRDWSAEFERRLQQGTATLLVTARGRERLATLSSAAAEAAERSAEPAGEGWSRVTIPIESLDYAADEILRLGTDAEVLEPPELRRRMAALAGRLAERYATDGAQASVSENFSSIT